MIGRLAMRKIDLTNQRFGRLLVVRESDIKKRTAWECLCDCGNTVVVTTTNLRNKGTKSCGCLRVDVTTETHTIHGCDRKSGRNRLYVIWTNMRERCSNPNNDAYDNYGGRGITVCDEWNIDFTEFKQWAISNGYNEDSNSQTIDRIDVNRGYSPDNCRWISRKEQANNKRNSRYVTYEGKRVNIAELSEITGVPYFLLYKRIVIRGWDVVRAVTTPKITHSR